MFEGLLSESLKPETSEKKKREEQTWARAHVYLKLMDFSAACEKIMNEYRRDYPEAYLSVLRNRQIYFPRAWMREYKRGGRYPIAETFQKYPLLIPILNAMFDHNRRWKEHSRNFQKMVSECEKVTGGKKHGKNFYSSFVVDKEFYETLAKGVEAKTDYVKKHFLGLVEAGVYRKLGSFDRKVSVYSDGYFQKRPSGGLTKQPWLIKEKKFLESLAAFKPQGI
ncbi:MAG: hypothetical protein JW836_16765 [Deltaproteobacteria bacterium]|nr:hypothetical protein [Deltaproteobacteria bacterium]